MTSHPLSNAKPVRTLGYFQELAVKIAMKKIWKQEKRDKVTDLSFSEWLVSPKK